MQVSWNITWNWAVIIPPISSLIQDDSYHIPLLLILATLILHNNTQKQLCGKFMTNVEYKTDNSEQEIFDGTNPESI